MAVIQTTYTDQVAPGYAGMVANAETSNRITRTNEDATAVPFGRAAFRGTGDHGMTVTPTAGGFLGIVIALYRNKETIFIDRVDLLKW